jgi:hypothetical protein
MDRRLVGKKVKVRLTSPDEFRVRVEEEHKLLPHVCQSCYGAGYVTNGMDGTPERCYFCDGEGSIFK